MESEKVSAAVEQYADMVYRIALNCVKNREAAEDITQDVFCKLLKTQKTFADAEHLKRWLIRCTVNRGKDLLSSAWYRTSVSLEEVTEAGSEEQTNGEMFDMIMRLPKKCRIICYMYYYEGYTTEEIASILRISGATVRVQLMKARNKLKEQWTEVYSYDGTGI